LVLHRAFDRYVLMDEHQVGQIAAVYDSQLHPMELP